MKKLLIVILSFALLLTSCSSSAAKMEEQELECKLSFDPADIKSVLKETDIVFLVKGLEYFETKLIKNSDIPKTMYIVNNLDIIKGDKNKVYKLLAMNGGIVTKLQLYNHCLNNKELKNIDKPSKQDEETKIKVYQKNYLELSAKKDYLIFAKANKKSKQYCVNGFTVLEYDKKSGNYINQFSGLTVSLDELRETLE